MAPNSFFFYSCLSSSLSLNILTSVLRLITQREAAAISLYYTLARHYAFGCIFPPLSPPPLPSPICLCGSASDLITAALRAGRWQRDYVKSQGNGCVTTLLRSAVTRVDECRCAVRRRDGKDEHGQIREIVSTFFDFAHVKR